MEVDDFLVLKGRYWPNFWPAPGDDAARKGVELAKSGGSGRFKGHADTAKGNSRFWDVSVSPIFGPGNQPTHILSISRDITDEWRAIREAEETAERQRLLTAELQHRIKNTLAMVGAIANQTMRGVDIDAARDAFNARLTH